MIKQVLATFASNSRILLGYLCNAAARMFIQVSPIRLAEESILSLADALVLSHHQPGGLDRAILSWVLNAWAIK